MERPPTITDLATEFREYKTEFYRLRYEFFKLSPVPACLYPDSSCFQPIGDDSYRLTGGRLCDNCAEFINQGFKRASFKALAENPDDDTNIPPESPANIMELGTVKIDTSQSMREIEADLKSQFDKMVMEARNIQGYKWKLRDRLRNASGKYYSKDELSYWRRCLVVYKLRIDGHGWEEIGTHVGKISAKKTGKTLPKGTVTRDIRDDFKEAERLIVSAVAGTFPEDPTKE